MPTRPELTAVQKSAMAPVRVFSPDCVQACSDAQDPALLAGNPKPLAGKPEPLQVAIAMCNQCRFLEGSREAKSCSAFSASAVSLQYDRSGDICT
jgi:hypothetical protein